MPIIMLKVAWKPDNKYSIIGSKITHMLENALHGIAGHRMRFWCIVAAPERTIVDLQHRVWQGL